MTHRLLFNTPFDILVKNFFESSSPFAPAIDAKIAEFVAYGWMEKTPTLLKLTKEGKLKADYIASELFLT
jgi:hypothetical protein